jgi:hypothetical protein
MNVNFYEYKDLYTNIMLNVIDCLQYVCITKYNTTSFKKFLELVYY